MRCLFYRDAARHVATKAGEILRKMKDLSYDSLFLIFSIL